MGAERPPDGPGGQARDALDPGPRWSQVRERSLINPASAPIPMARPTTLSDDAILEAAREVFLRRGPDATTADIAAHAGVSEGSLFKRWKTKDALRHACLRHVAVERVPWVAGLSARAGQRTLAAQLAAIGLEAIVAFRALMPTICMAGALGEAERREGRWPHPALEARAHLASYLRAERALGRLGDVDVEVLAHAFLGALFAYAHQEFVLAGRDPSPIPAEVFARAHAEMLVAGVAAPRSKARSAASSPAASRAAPHAPRTTSSATSPSSRRRSR